MGRAFVPFAGVLLGFSCFATDRMRIVRDARPPRDTLYAIRASGTVKLMTWNVGMLPGLVGKGAADLRRAHRICDRILAVAPHLLLLQEVFDENARAVFSGRLRAMYPYRVEKCGVGALLREDSGLYFASRLPVLEGSEVFVSFTARDPLLDERVASKGILGVWIDLRECGADLLLGVFNTHLHADHGEPGRYAAVRRRQIAQARRVIDRSVARVAGSRRRAVVLLGDLNIVGETEEYRRALELLPDAVDVVRSWSPDGAFFTWDPARNPMIEDPGGARERLDHVLAWRLGGGARLRGLICRGVELDRPAPGKTLSDHYGIVVSLGTTGPSRRLSKGHRGG
jgi:endonuclease/exonuclease/phosphatase family metal-dependent hydrolase